MICLAAAGGSTLIFTELVNFQSPLRPQSAEVKRTVHLQIQNTQLPHTAALSLSAIWVVLGAVARFQGRQLQRRLAALTNTGSGQRSRLMQRVYFQPYQHEHGGGFKMLGPSSHIHLEH